MQTQLQEKNINNNDFYDKIADDVKKVLIQLVSEAGHGKTSSLRTIVAHCKEKHPDLEFIIFDVSQAWYHNAPVKYRQLVTREKIGKGLIQNKYDCVYEMGQLGDADRRIFVGTLMSQHYQQRYQAKLKGKLDKYPFLVFVFEEANIYFGSYSFRTNDDFSQIFQQFVSVGRNYKMRGFLIATAEVGEISPSLRRRSRRIYGRVESEGDLARLRKKDKVLAQYIGSEIPRFSFIYYAEKPYGPVRVPDSVNHTPVDFIPIVEVKEPKSKSSWWLQFLLGLGVPFILLMFVLYFLQN